jgi:hypothetical protein
MKPGIDVEGPQDRSFLLVVLAALAGRRALDGGLGTTTASRILPVEPQNRSCCPRWSGTAGGAGLVAEDEAVVADATRSAFGGGG